MPQTEKHVAPQARRGRPRDPERLRRIVEAAHKHFNAHGLERASVDAIAADAGVSKMTIYSHFASKEGLFEAVIRDRTDRVMGGVAGVEALDPTQPQKALLAVGEQFLTLAREENALGQFRSLYGAAGSQPEACQAFYRQGADRLIGDLAAYLRRADAQGTLNIRHPRRAADL
ncbi:MAG TPA: TetR/AcrR family transcriptional regulator, partial [Ramlibacter sp.]|nr:TetR/AcrR family transcriptional regulator [Ramlibacter sp.]